MLKKIIKGVFGLCMLAGFILAIGTVGASDLELICFEKLLIRSGIAIGLMFVGLLGVTVAENTL